MKRATLLMVVCFAVSIASGGRLQAGLITFDDLTTRNNFFALGIEDSYQGFEWGFSNTPGLGGAIIPTNQTTGWASATVADPAISPAPTPVSGQSYAWNWDGPRSLFIDFQTPHDVSSGYFATLSSNYFSNALSVQLFGYDESNNLVGTSAPLILTHSFQQLQANLQDIRTLEIRANADSRWFSIDNLDVTPSSATAAVPEAPSLIGFAVVACIACVGVVRRTTNESNSIV
jgi:hypothetical protein